MKSDNGAGGSNGETPMDILVKAKASKIMMFPSRKLNLGNYNMADLSAGIEITFDKPVDLDGKEVKEAFEEARKIIKEEFTKQYQPYKKYFTKKDGD